MSEADARAADAAPAGTTREGVLTILALHGALGTAAQLAPLAERLRAAGARVIAPDFEGHGAGAPGERPYEMARFAEAALAALDAEGARAPAWVVGYSMGGYVGLCLARSAPDRVAGVFTLGTKTAWSPEAAERETRQLDAARIRAKVPKFMDLLAARHGEGAWEAVLDRTAAMMRAVGAAPPLDDAAFAALDCPVRVAVGDRDATVPVEEAAGLARRLPRGELEVLPATPHPIERVDWTRLTASVRQFVGLGP